jgi:dTDP-4-amino-4,6-dideoxygalactose transaminase
VERIHPLAVMESDAANGRVFNVGTGRPTTILRFAELLRAAYEAKVAPYAKPVFHLYVAQVPDRKKQEAAFDAANISHGIHYPIPVYLQPAFADLGYKAGSFPVAEALAPKIISLPMYPELKDSQIGHVTGACLKS